MNDPNQPYAGQPTWRDAVESRLGYLQRGQMANEQTLQQLQVELRGVHDSIDAVRVEISQQLAAGLGGLRADLGSLRPGASTPAWDWKLIALVACVVAGGLVGVGITVGKAWETQDSIAIVKGLTP